MLLVLHTGSAILTWAVGPVADDLLHLVAAHGRDIFKIEDYLAGLLGSDRNLALLPRNARLHLLDGSRRSTFSRIGDIDELILRRDLGRLRYSPSNGSTATYCHTPRRRV